MLAAAAASASAVCAAAVPSISGPSGLGPAPASFDLVSRVYVPYGLSATDLAFGMGAAEQIIYDATERYAYAVSEQGVLNVVDYADAAAPVVVTSLAVDLRGAVATDVEICPERGLLLVSVSGEVLNIRTARVGRRTDAGRVLAFESVRRSAPRTPKPLWQVQVGALPDMISPNRDCSLLAVANEGEGVYGGVHSSTGTGGVATGGGLVDPDGSVSLIHLPKQGPPSVSEVRLDALAPSDEHLIGLGVHLPLPLGAMEHFDLHSARHNRHGGTLDLGSARRAYRPVSQLEPEYLAWSADGSKVFVNLQENAAIVTVDVATATAERISPLGLTDWSAAGGTDGIDIVDDGACRLQHYDGLFSINSADTIGSFEVDGEVYVMAAMEGDRVRYGDFKEDQKLRSVVASNASFGKNFAAFRAPDGALQQVFDTFGESKLRVSIGSSGVDYSDPTSPRLERVVAFGARGVSIYSARDMALVWSSGSLLEREGCAAFPWAHNGEQDEEYAAVHGVLYNATSDEGLKEDIEDKSNPKKEGCDDGGDGRPGACPLGETVDRRSTKDGASAEALALGVACGRMIAVTATEKGGIAFVFDVSDPGSPVLLFTHHLSPARSLPRRFPLRPLLLCRLPLSPSPLSAPPILRLLLPCRSLPCCLLAHRLLRRHLLRYCPLLLSRPLPPQASRHANPTVAYAYGYLGDIDSETILFLDASHSPTGAAAVMFAGAWSGTISLYDLRMADGSRCTSLVGPTAQGDARGDGSLGAVGKPSPHPSPTAAPVPAPPVVAAPPTSSPGIEAPFAFGAAAVVLLVCAAYGCGTFLGLGCLPQSRAWTRMEEPVRPEILQPAK